MLQPFKATSASMPAINRNLDAPNSGHNTTRFGEIVYGAAKLKMRRARWLVNAHSLYAFQLEGPAHRGCNFLGEQAEMNRPGARMSSQHGGLGGRYLLPKLVAGRRASDLFTAPPPVGVRPTAADHTCAPRNHSGTPAMGSPAASSTELAGPASGSTVS